MADRQIMVQILGDAASLERAFAKSTAAANTFDARMSKLGAKTSSIGKTMTRDVTLPLTAAGVASVKMAQNFDLLISRMVGLGGVTEAQSKKFRQFILDLAPKVGKGPEELANALYQIVSAGVKGQRALDALTVSAKASAAGLGDTATVADAVTSVMNAYAKTGMTAATAANVLSAAVRDGKGEASSFAPVLGKVVAVAAQLGVPFDQAAAALAQMTKLGVPADDAATQLSATFSELLKTTPKAEKALEAMGLSAAGLRQELREKGLLATLQTLAEKTHGSTVAMAEAFPNVRALRGVLQLVGSAASGTAQTFDDVKNSTQSLSTAFGAASKTDAFKMQQALAQLKTAAIDLGTSLAPVAEAVARDIGKISKAFEDLSPHEKDVLIKLAEFAAVGGPLVLMTGKMITATGEIAKMAKALRGLAAAEALAGSSGSGGGFLAFLKRLGGGAALGGAALLGVTATDAMTHTQKKTISELGLQATATPGVFRDPHLPASNKYGYVTVNANGGTSPAAPPKAGSAAPFAGESAVQKNELAYAAKYGPGSGITYTWGGVSPITGFDCSGYLMAAYAAAGVKIPHNTVAQFNDPHAIVVLPGGEEPGDGVYFKTDGPGAAPQHVGIYIGGGQFIEYFSAGKPAKISSLAASGGYMGARRWLKIAPSTGGGGQTTGGGGSTSKAKKTPWKGATQATIITAHGQVAAMLKGLPATLDPVEKNAVAHIKKIQDDLRVHMSPADLAKDRVELAKWGKVLHDEVSKNGKKAAAAAAAAKQTFDRALSLDMSQVLRDFDEKFAAKQQAFDRDTQAGLAQFVVAQTPEEKALADFEAKRQADADAAAAAQRNTDLASAQSALSVLQAVGVGGTDSSGNVVSQADIDAATQAVAAAQDAINQAALDAQQAGLQAAADASRVAQDAKTAADQQAYQDDRDAQKQHLQDLNDDQRTALQNSLDDWTTSLEAKKAAWTDFLNWLSANGYDTSGLINPNTGQPTGGSSGGGSSNRFGTTDPGIAAFLGAAPAAASVPDALARYIAGHATAFAAGGIVTRPTIALIGENGREAVIPLPAGGLAGAGGPTVVVQIEKVYALDRSPGVAREIAKAVEPHLARIVKL